MRPPKGTAAAIRKAQDNMRYFLQMAMVAKSSYRGYLRAAAKERGKLRALGAWHRGAV
jgi:hypothetical protein